MTKVDGPVSSGNAATANERLAPPRQPPFLIAFYRSAVVKKWLMAVSGIILLAYVLAHMVGNLKVFIDKHAINTYAEWLRNLGEPALPRTVVLWGLRTVIIAALFIHILSAYQLTRMNHKARPVKYQSPRDYAAANFASRTMRWTGIIILAFLIFHLMDLTWGNANGQFVRGDPYNNLVYSFRRPSIAIVYVVANVALAFHLYHGTWSIFQSMGFTNPRYNALRRRFAQGFAAVILLGNVSFPIAVQLHAVDLQCPHSHPTTEPCHKVLT
jgi:succinate dehydrogenase cytochrome b subunit